jgi:heme/copper-type cytochrome/quinol oxidase subunit 3
VAADDPARLSPKSLRQVRAAQLRARATRRAIGQVLLGSVFLVGALAYARAPDRHQDSNLMWMTGLLVLSTIDVALGTRTLARVRRRRARLWVAATAAWGVLSTVLVGFLLRG